MKCAFGLVLLAALSACAGNDPQSVTNSVTRAVYDNNVSAIQPYFDEALRQQVSRGSVGVISDKMHELGAYDGLTFVGSDATKNEYSFRANFSNGNVNIVVRVDPDGRLAAYRVFPS